MAVLKKAISKRLSIADILRFDWLMCPASERLVPNCFIVDQDVNTIAKIGEFFCEDPALMLIYGLQVLKG